jgi:Holliday junction resolvasome RuvABC endonuclease subunit
MNILALDLGTKCGWARQTDSGVWNLKAKATESIGQRYLNFKKQLNFYSTNINLIIYEEVIYHCATEAGRVFGGFQAILQTFCLEESIEYKGVNVSTLKKYATGKGNAKKDDMICAASLKFKGINVIDDNHADALWLLDYATKKLNAVTSGS